MSRTMKLTIIQTGEVPEKLRPQFGPYAPMFHRMFAREGWDFETVRIAEGEPFPEARALDAIVITGSSAGVYDNHLAWMEPLRNFVREAYAGATPMLGVCFGHQIMADALGGDVRKSEKGWGLGRHVYDVGARPDFLGGNLPEFAIACSHQDQVIVPPQEASVFLSSEFTPNAGLLYGNGRALSVQPHPEFADDYTVALAELRRGKTSEENIAQAVASMVRPSDSSELSEYLGAFLRRS
jgi:GMP synthase-like glutamine amidotransferase